ncbi:MAG: LytTR family transcriptional regulator [Marinicaulis sp.]|nr:LytTR family transcriptional regulator [Marinicaulis sp.]
MSKITPSLNSTNPQSDDARADHITFYWIAAFITAFLVVDILSRMTELARNGQNIYPVNFTIYETSSSIVILALFPALSWVASRAAPGQHDWRRIVGVHVLAALLFSIVHIIAMVAIRKIAFLAIYDAPYIFTDNILREFIYEFRKDAVTYALIIFFISFGRQLAQQRRELTAAREDAKKTHRLTLKCGGRSIWINASDVRWVKSASNYVEVAANGKTHLARATLNTVETQLNDAGVSAVRVHRSYVVNTEYIEAIQPTGEGDVKIKMSDGEIIPGSRRYRDRLPVNCN